MTFRSNATAHEARTSAGLAQEQWSRFYLFTTDEVKELSKEHKNWTTWIRIPANEKYAMLERINAKLLAEGIQSVGMNILKWRVSQLIRTQQRDHSDRNSRRRGRTVASSASQMQAPTPSESRLFDPIRDLDPDAS